MRAARTGGAACCVGAEDGERGRGDSAAGEGSPGPQSEASSPTFLTSSVPKGGGPVYFHGLGAATKAALATPSSPTLAGGKAPAVDEFPIPGCAGAEDGEGGRGDSSAGEGSPGPRSAGALDAFARGALQERHDAMVTVCENALASGERLATSLGAALGDLETARAELEAARAERDAARAELEAARAENRARAGDEDAEVIRVDSDSDAPGGSSDAGCGRAGSTVPLKRRRAGERAAPRKGARLAAAECWDAQCWARLCGAEAGGDGAGAASGDEAGAAGGAAAGFEAGAASGDEAGAAGFEALGPRARLTSLARAAGGRAGGAAVAAVEAAPAAAPRLAALSGPRHTLLTGDVSRVKLARPDGYVLKHAELALSLPWTAKLWNRRAGWRPFSFNLADQRVVYYDAREVDAGRAVVPLLEEEIKALIARELREMPIEEFIAHGARAHSTSGKPALQLYKQVFPAPRAVGYQEVDVVRATKWVDAEAAPEKARLATVTLRFSQLARSVLDLTLDVRQLAALAGGRGCPLYLGLWSAPAGAGGAVPDAARWGEDDEEVRQQYMRRVEERVLFDGRVLRGAA